MMLRPLHFGQSNCDQILQCDFSLHFNMWSTKCSLNYTRQKKKKKSMFFCKTCWFVFSGEHYIFLYTYLILSLLIIYLLFSLLKVQNVSKSFTAIVFLLLLSPLLVSKVIEGRKLVVSLFHLHDFASLSCGFNVGKQKSKPF